MTENYKKIRAVYDESVIRVYQAYNDGIADEAVKLGHFGSRFKMERMTWIKPSFLWAMYRSGWASKDNQNRILAIDMYREGFDYIVKNAVSSTYNSKNFNSIEEWKKKVKSSDIRCQWDPERDIFGNPLEYRSIQLGLRGKAVYNYVHEWIKEIEDITPYVIKIKKMIDNKEDVKNLLPDEKEYIIN